MVVQNSCQLSLLYFFLVGSILRNNPLRWLLYKSEYWNSERLSNLPEIIELENDKARICT